MVPDALYVWKVNLKMDDPRGALPPPSATRPIFNLPRVVSILILVMVAIHLVRVYALTPQAQTIVLLTFAFLPVRYSGDPVAQYLPGGIWADLWSPLTYAFLHGDGWHLLFNMLWLAVFGSAVARRFGAPRFLTLSIAATLGGAAAHLFAYPGDDVPVVGASAAISGHMAAASRFMFEPGGPLSRMRLPGAQAYQRPARPLLRTLTAPSVATFLFVWFALNILIGLWSQPLIGASIAWQAHIGGFLIGLILFPILDPIPPRQ